MGKILKYIVGVVFIILIDQGSKLWVYKYIELGQGEHIKLLGNLLKITYVLNYGMAFGLQLGFKYGKLLITLFRIIAVVGIAFHIVQAVNRFTPPIWIWGWALVLGGAIGNSIDSVFYGVYLDNAPSKAPMKWLHGQVIDMIHIDFWSGELPSWIPIWGGYDICILPIFNIADVAIFFGMLMVLFSFKEAIKVEKSFECK